MTLVISTLLNLTRNKQTFKNANNTNNEVVENVNAVLHSTVYMLLILVIGVVPAVLIATRCNPNNTIFYGIVAFLFADIYLFQWAIRKFVMKTEGYCECL